MDGNKSGGIGYQVRIQVKEEYFWNTVERAVCKSVIMIQKHMKRHLVQKRYKKILAKEKAYSNVKWRYSGKKVYVIGELCKPHWVHKIKLKWCPLRGIYVKYFKMPLDPMKQYRYLFVVDGKYCFDASQPCVGGGRTRYVTNCLVPKTSVSKIP